MKGVAFLIFFAFIAGFLPNRVEGRCYACGYSSGRRSCEEFEKASVEGKKEFIKEKYIEFDDVDNPKNNGTEGSTEKPASRRRRAVESSDFDCSSCSKFDDGKERVRNCATNDEKSYVNGKLIVTICKGDLCNGAGRLGSLASVALLATALSLLKGSLF